MEQERKREMRKVALLTIEGDDSLSPLNLSGEESEYF